jgi:hypothetical protein
MRQDLRWEGDVEFDNQVTALLVLLRQKLSLGVDDDVAGLAARHALAFDAKLGLRSDHIGRRDSQHSAVESLYRERLKL